MSETSDGSQVHVGNSVHASDLYAMVIMRIWDDGSVSGPVLLDGNDTSK